MKDNACASIAEKMKNEKWFLEEPRSNHKSLYLLVFQGLLGMIVDVISIILFILLSPVSVL